jgi:hypothetical protein
MSTVHTTHHEVHHDWAQEENGIGQQSQNMYCMFGEQKEGPNGKKAKEDPGSKVRLKPTAALW